MKEISYEEYLSTNNDNYVDVENPADCSVRLKNKNIEIMVHKDVNKDDDLEHWFDGHDENVCIVYRESYTRIVYDCTWNDVLKEYRLTERERIGARIAELRKAKGLTQEQLAKKAGFTQSNIWRIENGKYSVGIDILAKLAEALDANIEIIRKQNQN